MKGAFSERTELTRVDLIRMAWHGKEKEVYMFDQFIDHIVIFFNCHFG